MSACWRTCITFSILLVVVLPRSVAEGISEGPPVDVVISVPNSFENEKFLSKSYRVSVLPLWTYQEIVKETPSQQDSRVQEIASADLASQIELSVAQAGFKVDPTLDLSGGDHYVFVVDVSVRQLPEGFLDLWIMVYPLRSNPDGDYYRQTMSWMGLYKIDAAYYTSHKKLVADKIVAGFSSNAVRGTENW